MVSKEDFSLIKQGAEAKVYVGTYLGRPAVLKERFPKTYRHPTLDALLTKERMKAEARALVRCRTIGIRAPAVFFVDLNMKCIVMEHVQNSITLRDYIDQTQKESADTDKVLKSLLEKIGKKISIMHTNGLIHGDLTTSNVLVQLNPQLKVDPTEEPILIDFGLSFISESPEDKGVDLYVLERAFISTHPKSENLFHYLLQSYINEYGEGVQDIVKKFEEVKLRGRKRLMVG